MTTDKLNALEADFARIEAEIEFITLMGGDEAEIAGLVADLDAIDAMFEEAAEAAAWESATWG